MTSIGRNEADVVSVEVHGTCRSNGHKHSHSSLPRHVELPLRGIGMPMEFAHTSGLDHVRSSSDILCHRKDMRLGGAYFPLSSSPGRRHRLHFEYVFDGRLHFLAPNCCPILRQRFWQV